MGDPRHAASALRAITPTPVVDEIDWSSLQPEQASLQRDEYAQTHADLLFTAQWKSDEGESGSELYLHLLYEHQSTPDRWMALRFFNMAHALWKRHRERHSEERSLPALLCYVLYHGAAPWRAPTTLLELIDAPAAIREQLGPYLPVAGVHRRRPLYRGGRGAGMP